MEKLRGLELHLIFISIFLVTCLGVENMSVVCSEQERLALLNFKNSIKDDYKMLSSWVGNDCCRWERIKCDGVTGNVESLHLRGHTVDYVYVERIHMLVGDKVDSSLAELRHLKYLDLSGNDFGGSRIPNFIGSLIQLRYLNLSDAEFYGLVPPHIGNLSNLKVLDLSKNYGLMTDDVAWTFRLPLLEHLDLSSLFFSGTQNWDMLLYMIPSLKDLSLSFCKLSVYDIRPFLNSSRILPEIKHLDLGFNSFKGPLPCFLQNLTSLSFLDLSGYRISLQWNFANLLNMIPSLSELHLSSCGVENTFLSSPHHNFSTLSNIQHLDLSDNLVEGMFPSVITNMSFLRVLDISRNWLNISVPDSLVRLAHLRVIDLSSSGLTGPIPKSLRRLRFLEVLDLSCNHITGRIPTFLWNLIKLDLSFNQLNGSIPESFGKLASLTDLNVEFNRLTGPIPASLGRLGSLKSISMRSNLLNGNIPVSIGQLAKLRSIDFANNSLEGIVFEAHFAKLLLLKEMDTSYNTKLKFNVSREWVPPFQLVNLLLSSCNVGNGFPQWLQNQRKLDKLVLSNISISGPLPKWLQNMNIFFLDLSHNQLSGSLTNLPIVGISRALILKNNLFNGSIPRSLCRWLSLRYLDLSRNMLTGGIPKCLENLQFLLTMRFSSNRLYGVIPSFIALTYLRQLNLNDNNFIGELPRELGNSRDLTVLDLGDNKLSGNIPEWIGENLTSLVVLRLHKNKFTGRIPRSLCKASQLRILDVAYNNLTGSIPRCIGELNAMAEPNLLPSYYVMNIEFYDENVKQVMKGVDIEYTKTWKLVYNMDLSSNKLVGEIPVELTALCMLMGLNLSNNHLSRGIPYNIGNMTQLFSLDLSRNKLIGKIPQSMAALNFLSHLNLSHNNLSGQIPTGSQLQTLIDPSIYVGNKYLCGAPLSKNCSNHEHQTTTLTKKYEAGDVQMKVWPFYVDIMCGFVTGFWGIIGILWLKKQWRMKLFMFVEETMERMHVAVVVRVAKMKTPVISFLFVRHHDLPSLLF